MSPNVFNNPIEYNEPNLHADLTKYSINTPKANQKLALREPQTVEGLTYMRLSLEIRDIRAYSN